MTDLIAQARSLCEKATPGPWRTRETADYSEIFDEHSWGKALSPLALVGSNTDDAAFIAASRTLVPALADALENKQREIDTLRTAKESAEKRATFRWRCSRCGNTVSVTGYKICPNCGALMDGLEKPLE